MLDNLDPLISTYMPSLDMLDTLYIPADPRIYAFSRDATLL